MSHPTPLQNLYGPNTKRQSTEPTTIVLRPVYINENNNKNIFFYLRKNKNPHSNYTNNNANLVIAIVIILSVFKLLNNILISDELNDVNVLTLFRVIIRLH